MRKIKFRMWNNCIDKEMSKMFYDIEQVMECLKQQINFNNLTHLGYNHIGDGNAFMQFTGLKDKNGKEIYEGDIVLFKGHLCKIEYRQNYCDYVFNTLKYKHRMLNVTKANITKFNVEIKGNIHENPGLL